MTRTRIGMLNMVSATAPEMIEYFHPRLTENTRKPNMPTTMEGSEERVSIAVEAIEVMGPSGAYSTRKIAPPRLMGTEISSVMASM